MHRPSERRALILASVRTLGKKHPYLAMPLWTPHSAHINDWGVEIYDKVMRDAAGREMPMLSRRATEARE